MSERWKPKHGEVYYCVTIIGAVYNHVWCDGPLDSSYYKSGNCFKTKAKAEAAAEKVKALLLNLHEPTKDRNQLPKLTAEVFDREDCPEWAEWAAVDDDGSAYYYYEKPELTCSGWISKCCNDIIYAGEFCPESWKNSLIQRNAKALPDWCKVGEWVCIYNMYAERFDYFKVSEVANGRVICKDGYCFASDEIKQARLRPYNEDELRSLVGKVIDTDYGAAFLVIACGNSHITVGISSSLKYSAHDLLDERYTIDGKPCGVLEHLNEKGEWVE